LRAGSGWTPQRRSPCAWSQEGHRWHDCSLVFDSVLNFLLNIFSFIIFK
jgi:hypothetical protein